MVYTEERDTLVPNFPVLENEAVVVKVDLSVLKKAEAIFGGSAWFIDGFSLIVVGTSA